MAGEEVGWGSQDRGPSRHYEDGRWEHWRSAAAAIAGKWSRDSTKDCKAKGGLGKKGQGEDDPQGKQHREQYAEGGSA